ncbi:maleate cis-trans isomerase family protein [Streptomyces rimosus]|uniref:maleate cis-trans isomerase family protein n=1 Tax=Streptomyces rimosus TaxID=1927 RepID=UPI00067DCB08|nr:hypothetical protein [Streptomyces rimosus]
MNTAAVNSYPDRAGIPFEDATPDGTVGLLALATDANIEDTLRSLLPPSVGLCTTRLANTDPITAASLCATRDRITEAARTILPGGRLDALVYGCTAGAAAIGHGEVERLLRAAHPAVQCLTPVSSAAAAMRYLGVRRPAILTPNVRELNVAIARHFGASGFEVADVVGLELAQDAHIGRVPPHVLVRAARHACGPRADGLLVCCTSLRVTPVIDRIEALVGRPVVTSNQAVLWDLARRLGFPAARTGLGQLLAPASVRRAGTALRAAAPAGGRR